jgi:oxalate decarboxylase/phosphoglucose isomerase-like protein (cupin superfamily)
MNGKALALVAAALAVSSAIADEPTYTIDNVAGPMTSFYCPSGSKHGIRNIGDTELKYLVIKKYLSD